MNCKPRSLIFTYVSGKVSVETINDLPYVYNNINDKWFSWCTAYCYVIYVCHLKKQNGETHHIKTNVCKHLINMIYFHLRIRTEFIGVGIFVIVIVFSVFIIMVAFYMYIKSKFVKFFMA